MKNLILTLTFGCFICLSCNNQSCNNIPVSFSSYQNAANSIKSATFKIKDSFSNDSWLTEAFYYSCDELKGYLIIRTNLEKEYIFNNLEIEVWKQFKNSESKGKFYNSQLRDNPKYLFELNQKSKKKNIQKEIEYISSSGFKVINNQVVPITVQEAQILLSNKIKLNNSSASMLRLGHYFLCGEGADLEEAKNWLSKSGEKNNIYAINYLIDIANRGYTCMGNYFELERNLQQWEYWNIKAAELGNIKNIETLAGYYYHNNDFSITSDVKKLKKAFMWYEKCAMRGVAECQYNLGQMYGLGRGTLKDEYEGVKWVRKSADNGDIFAKISLARMYFNGTLIPGNRKKAIKIIKEIYENEDYESEFMKEIYHREALEVWNELELWKYE